MQKNRGASKLNITKFDAIVKDLHNYLEQNPRVVDVIREQIMKDAVYGEGPTIYITSTVKGMHFEEKNGRIEIDYSLVKFLENFKPESDMENAALNLDFAGGIFHEYTHKKDYELNGNFTSDPDRNPGMGKQKSKSKFGHRGVDVQMSVTGTSQGAITDGGKSGEYNFFIGIEEIQKVMNRIDIVKHDATVPYSKKNVLPKDQKTSPRF